MAEAEPEERKGVMARMRTRSRSSMSTSRSRSRSSSRSRDGRPSYRFLMTIQRISGLPANWSELSIQHPAEEQAMNVQLSDGVAHVHRGIAFERSFRRSVDRQSDAKFRLLGENGKKFAKIHLDLEQLRQEIDLRDNIIAKIVTFQDDMGLGTIKMEFKLGYFAIDTQTSDQAPAPLSSEEAVVFDEVTVITPVGPLGASFANTLIPPTIIRLVPLPDGSESPLAGKIHARSELIKFNGIDATLWTLDDFKDHLIASKNDVERTLVFSVPRLPPDALEAAAPAAAEPAVAEQPAAAEEEQAAAEEVATDAADAPVEVEAAPEEDPEEAPEEAAEGDGEEQEESAAPAAAAAVVVGAVGAAAVVAGASAGDDQSEPADEAQAEPEEVEPEAEPEAEPEPAAAEEVPEQEDEAGKGEDMGYNDEPQPEPEENEAAVETVNPVAQASGPEFGVSVPNYVINATHQFVMYDIVCQGVDQEARSYRVLRRFKNFEELKLQLEQELDGAVLPDLPSKWSWSALFKRFDETLVENRRIELEKWLQTVYSLVSKTLRNNTLHDFLTAVPEHNEVLNFQSKEKVEVVLKESGDVKLYGSGFDLKTPRMPLA